MNLAPLHPLFAETVTHVIAHRVSENWPWYIIRAAGFTAAGLLGLLVISGIGQVTGISYRIVAPVKAWAIHKALALALCVAIAIHIGFLLIDHYLPFTLAQILVPLVSHYSNHTELFGLPLGGIAVTMGILAMYGVVILVATSLGWIDSHARTWRVLHYLSYVVVLLVFFHVAYSGTDVKYGLFRNAWIGLGLVVVAAIAVRLWRAGTTAKIRRAPDAAGTIPVARPDRPE